MVFDLNFCKPNALGFWFEFFQNIGIHGFVTSWFGDRYVTIVVLFWMSLNFSKLNQEPARRYDIITHLKNENFNPTFKTWFLEFSNSRKSNRVFVCISDYPLCQNNNNLENQQSQIPNGITSLKNNRKDHQSRK